MKLLKINLTNWQKYYSDFGVQLRLFIMLTVAFLISINFVVLYFLVSLKKQYNNHLKSEMTIVSQKISDELQSNAQNPISSLQKPEMQNYLKITKSSGSFDHIKIIYPNEEVIFSFPRNSASSSDIFWQGIDEEVIKSIKQGVMFFSDFYEVDGQIYRSFYRPVYKLIYNDPLVIKIESEQTFLGRLEKVMPILVILRTVGIILIFVISYFFVRSAVTPIKQLSKEVQDYRMTTEWEDRDTNETDLRLALQTFRQMVAELKEKEKILQSLYDSAEKRAEHLKNYNDYILESISSGVVSFDTEGQITVFNRAAEKIIGISEKEAKKLSIENLFAENPDVIQLLHHSLQKGREHNRVEISLKNRQGKTLWISLTSSILRDDKNNKIGTTFLLIDQTELKKLQEQINLKERLTALGEMSAGIAHEFRNSLATIIGYTRLLGKKLPEKDNKSEILKSIMEESLAQEKLIRQFLDFTRPTNLTMNDINTEKLLDDAIFSVESQLNEEGREKFTFSKDYEKNLAKIRGDYTHLKQVFSNIILNGIQAMPEGGELKVCASNSVGEQQQLVSISILDMGKGIKQEDHSRIFTPFFTTKNKGTGLGLALSHKIISQHEGTIDFMSDGNHTIFTINLPVSKVC